MIILVNRDTHERETKVPSTQPPLLKASHGCWNNSASISSSSPLVHNPVGFPGLVQLIKTMWWLYVPAIGEQRGQIPERFFRILFFFSPWGVYLVSFYLNYKLHLGIMEWRWQDSKLILSVYAKHSLCYLKQMRLEGCVVAQINWSAPTDEAPIVIFYCSHRERDKPNFTETMSTYNFTCYFKGGFTKCNSHTIIVPHSFIFNF